jgi:hypothetical protein
VCNWSVGPVQREIESAGFSTVVISTIPELTASVGAPRLVAVEHPMGRTMGAPGDKQRQMEVLKAGLQAVERMQTAGMSEHLPYVWHESPVQARADGAPPSPISAYLRKHPWLFPRLLNLDIPETP